MESKISGHKIFNMVGVGKRNNTKRIFLMVLKVGDCKPIHRTHGGSDPASAVGAGAAVVEWSPGEMALSQDPRMKAGSSLAVWRKSAVGRGDGEEQPGR